MKKIDSVLLENRSFKPSDNFSSKANISSLDKYNELCSLANSNYEKFWGDLANKHLDWDKKFTKILDDENKPFFKVSKLPNTIALLVICITFFAHGCNVETSTRCYWTKLTFAREEPIC